MCVRSLEASTLLILASFALATFNLRRLFSAIAARLESRARRSYRLFRITNQQAHKRPAASNRVLLWQKPAGQTPTLSVWRALQSGRSGACARDSNYFLVDTSGKPVHSHFLLFEGERKPANVA